MNPTKQKILQKANLKFKEELELQKKFFSKPDMLVLLGALCLSMLKKFIDKNFAEDDVKKFIQSDPIAKAFLNYTSNNFDEQILSEALLVCQRNEAFPEDLLPHFSAGPISAEDFLKVASTVSDFDSKLNFDIFGKLKTTLNTTQNTAAIALSYLYMLYHIILMTINLIQNSEYPSHFRTKYIQRLSRNLAGVMKSQWDEVPSNTQAQWQKTITMLSQIDNIVVALAMATSMYLNNRKLLQSRSHDTLQSIAKDKACIDLLQPFDVSVNAIPFRDNLNCPVSLDNVITPHVPIEVKLSNISCEVSTNELRVLPDAIETVDLVTKAIIKNNRSDKMSILLSIGSKVDQKTLLGVTGSTPVFSPIAGYIDHLQTNQITLRDISDTSNDSLASQINLLSTKYQQLNDVKFFLKDYYVASLYPIMLSISIVDDASTRDIYKSVQQQFNLLTKKYAQEYKDYEKSITNITSKDNVEKHAKNETLIKIKEDIEAQETLFYKNTALIGKEAYNLAKATTVKTEEYQLNSYYSDLIKSLSAITNLNAIEASYKDLITGYFNKRTKTKVNAKTQTIDEGNEINAFFQDLWKQFGSLPSEINDIQKTINSLSMFATYSITKIDGEDYRLYTIAEPTTCKPAPEDVNLDANTKYGFGDIEYWMKYCAFATLASVTNPVSGWSTGIIFPVPILFPVVYIPIKPIATKYGFIVLGLSICGMYIFPWSLFVNYTSDYSLPVADPTIALKNEISALKKTINQQISQFRKVTIKKMLDKIKSELTQAESQISQYKDQLTVSIAEKDAIRALELRELIATTSITKWKLEQKYEILDNAYKTGASVKDVDTALAGQEKQLNAQLDKLTSMFDNVEKIIAPLPITLQPETANFGATLKNPKPLIKIKDRLDDNINEDALSKVTDKFRLDNADFMNSAYGTLLSKEMTNFDAYKSSLIENMPTIKTQDSFPRYEQLSVSNVQWMRFLYTDFVAKGARTYGFPGFDPFPI